MRFGSLRPSKRPDLLPSSSTHIAPLNLDWLYGGDHRWIEYMPQRCQMINSAHECETRKRGYGGQGNATHLYLSPTFYLCLPSVSVLLKYGEVRLCNWYWRYGIDGQAGSLRMRSYLRISIFQDILCTVLCLSGVEGSTGSSALWPAAKP